MAIESKILVFNAGSSSLKFGCYKVELGANGKSFESLICGGEVEKIGEKTVAQVAKEIVHDLPKDCDAIGVRVVHGGSRFYRPVEVTTAVLKEIRALASLAPLHNTADADLIEALRKASSNTKIIAVFDTAFHHTLPKVASTYALPLALNSKYALRRYGFHGLAHRWVTQKLLETLGKNDARLILCHLGNGASVCAVRNGQSIDTSMGFTPLEGLVMGTRCGDLDPGLLIYLQKAVGLNMDQIEQLLNHESGLYGLSNNLSYDIRDLWSAVDNGDQAAQLAIDIFAYRVAKYIGAYAVALEGFDAIAFSGGIGEHDVKMRAKICKGLGFLGLHLDLERNAAAPRHVTTCISREGSSISAWVVPADENRQMVREIYEELRSLVRH